MEIKLDMDKLLKPVTTVYRKSSSVFPRKRIQIPQEILQKPLDEIYEYLQKMGIDISDDILPPVKGLVRKFSQVTQSQFYDKRIESNEIPYISNIKYLLANRYFKKYISYCLDKWCPELQKCWDFKNRSWNWGYFPKITCIFFDEPVHFYLTKARILKGHLNHLEPWTINRNILQYLYELGLGYFTWKEIFEDNLRLTVEQLRIQMFNV